MIYLFIYLLGCFFFYFTEKHKAKNATLGGYITPLAAVLIGCAFWPVIYFGRLCMFIGKNFNIDELEEHLKDKD